MLVAHFSPRLYSRYEVVAELFSFSSQELGLNLMGGKDLLAARPFRNQGYLVPHPANSEKPTNGFLVKLNRRVKTFSTTTTWMVRQPGEPADDARIVSHILDYEILDEEFDAISDAMILWYARSGTQYKDRFPKNMPTGWSPSNAQPCLELTPMSRKSEVNMNVAGHGERATIEQREAVRMHTIELSRITDGWPGSEVEDIMPPLETIFTANVPG